MPRPSAHIRLTLALVTLSILSALAFGCSGKSTGAPAAGVSGPTINLTFPGPGAERTFQFNEIGTFEYHCIPHQSFGMVGFVDVVDANSTAHIDSVVDVGGTRSFRFTPDTARVKVGRVVHWVNSSALTTHTVTRP